MARRARLDQDRATVSETTKTVARYNLTGVRLTAWREARGILTAEDWTATAAAEYLAWYQQDIGADADPSRRCGPNCGNSRASARANSATGGNGPPWRTSGSRARVTRRP